ncbi:MAG: hypothetical protein ACT4NT_01685 [Nitrososphaerota archaeon]
MKDEIKCVLCNGTLAQKYLPMKDWDVKGFLCGKCYTKKISEHYPGKHVRVNVDKE